MSLRDELLKAGVVSKQKADKIESETRHHRRKLKKDKNEASAEAARQAEEHQRLQAEVERKREHDRQLNREREALKQRKAAEASASQLVESHRQNDPRAELSYYVLINERFIRSVRVTPQQRKLLATGRLGVACNPDNEYDFPLIDRQTALRLAEICPDRLVLLHPEGGDGEEDEAERG